LYPIYIIIHPIF